MLLLSAPRSPPDYNKKFGKSVDWGMAEFFAHTARNAGYIYYGCSPEGHDALSPCL